jgi:hypothetical protein
LRPIIRWTRRGTTEPDYSAAIAEKFIIGFDNNDYDSISIYFCEELKDIIKNFKAPGTTDKTYATASEAFSVMTAIRDLNKNIIKDEDGKPLHIQDKIGHYQAGTLKFSRFFSMKSDSSKLFYKAKYSNEPNGYVKIQIDFKNENGKMLISSFGFISKTLLNFMRNKK